MHACPVCLSHDYRVIEERDRVPVLQNVIVETEEQARAFPTARLKICGCKACGFVWNAAFDPSAIDYSSNYNNSVQASGVYLAHQRAMAAKVLSIPGDLHYLEIGCGEGEFIEALDATGRLASAVGFDPAFHGQREFGPHVTIWQEYFTTQTAEKVPGDINVVCSRHTIEHIPNPRDFIRDIAAFVKERNLKLFLETPDVSWIFRHTAFEDFFYEHCSLFTPHSMQLLLAEFGLKSEVSAVYNGQYMWVEAERGDGAVTEKANLDLTEGYAVDLSKAVDHWRAEIGRMKENGKVAIWGAASKGVTFSLLMETIDCAIDLNPSKQNCFMPVTAVPIVSPETARDMGVSAIIVMNPNYEAEIRAMIDEMNWPVTVTSLRS